jgi:hypothetical protein
VVPHRKYYALNARRTELQRSGKLGHRLASTMDSLIDERGMVLRLRLRQAGQLLTGARLFGQDGQPVQLGSPYCTDEATGEFRRTASTGYPYYPRSLRTLPPILDLWLPA